MPSPQSLKQRVASNPRLLATLEAKLAAEKARRATDRVREEQAKRGSLSLPSFIREGWSVLEPSIPYVHGLPVDAVAEHLQAVTDGQIKNLVINQPPGTMKSLETAVFWQAYEWGPVKRPELRYISTSHSADFSSRDARKTRDLVMSDWYTELWPHVRLTRTGETDFENDRRGFRKAYPFTRLTGARGDRFVLDDPQSAEEAESPDHRVRGIRIFREQVPNRINDAATSAIVMIAQRLNAQDLSAIALELGWTALILPMEFEPERRCRTVLGIRAGRPHVWQDPRTRDGELLFPERFSRGYVEHLKLTMGSFAIASQLQQRPTPREGGLFKQAWFTEERFVAAAPAGTRWVRHWDLAATEKTSGSNPAYTAGVKLGKTMQGRYIVGDVRRAQAGPAAVKEMIKVTAALDGHEVEISLPQDPGAAGKMVAFDMVSALAGYRAYAAPESGDKVQRAIPMAVQAEIGNLDIVRGEWNAAFIDELCLFPGGKFKDQVDALSGAFARLAKTPDVLMVAAVVGSSPNSVPGGYTPRQTF
jgi:predicted phage terminase large subunit-like protein